ncbi:hypothetical protein C8F04DRAFT_1235225 [Mycena alexandri]|uniref:Uncharacterized protein n=1 Tax=Mycena alexandri TaxID=1745969 RepID=A0AAD6WYW1_9AGAR|nr:hypothetical protein C8F04DRAFT_1235225 [Mycena alexandri]
MRPWPKMYVHASRPQNTQGRSTSSPLVSVEAFNFRPTSDIFARSAHLGHIRNPGFYMKSSGPKPTLYHQPLCGLLNICGVLPQAQLLTCPFRAALCWPIFRPISAHSQPNLALVEDEWSLWPDGEFKAYFREELKL